MSFYFKEVGSPDAPRKIFSNGATIRLWDVSSDGQTIIYSVAGEGTEVELFVPVAAPARRDTV